MLIGILSGCQSVRQPTDLQSEESSNATSIEERADSLFLAYSAETQARISQIIDQQFFSGVNPVVSEAKLELQRIQRAFQIETEGEGETAAEAAVDACLALDELVSSLSAEESLEPEDRKFFDRLSRELQKELD